LYLIDRRRDHFGRAQPCFHHRRDQVSSQLHQHFTRHFFVQKCFAQLFSNYILGLNFFGKKILAQSCLLNVEKIGHWGRFHQHFASSLHKQIPRAQKDWQLDWNFMLLGYSPVKTSCKHVGEIDPRCHQHFTSSFLPKMFFIAFQCLQFVFVIVWQAKMCAKAAPKVVVKLITDCPKPKSSNMRTKIWKVRKRQYRLTTHLCCNDLIQIWSTKKYERWEINQNPLTLDNLIWLNMHVYE